MKFLQKIWNNLIGSRNTFLMLFFLGSLFPMSTLAQSYDGLESMKTNEIQVYYSKDAKKRADVIVQRCDSVMSYYKKMLDFSPEVKLLVLNPGDWPKFTEGAIYGMPHYKNDKTLVVASENNDFWRSFIPPTGALPKELAIQVTKAYSDDNSNLSMQPFFDLLAIHELAHAFHKQAGLNMQRKWLSELFANMFLHTYIAEKEPSLLPALTIFPQMVISGGTKGLKYTSLDDFENNYNDLGKNHPKNYGWYQCRLHAGAADIYNSGKTEAFKNLWLALGKNKAVLNTDDLTSLLSKAHVSISDLQLNWDNK